MRQSAILNDEYEEILIREAKKTGLITPKYDFSAMIDDAEKVADAEKHYYAFLDSKVDTRKNLFRTVLLFDEIILPHAPGEYNYDLLEKQGCFKVIPFDDFYYDTSNSFKGDIGKKEYVLHAKILKPALLPILEERLKSYFRLIPKGISYKELISILYDCTFEKEAIPRKYNYTIEINKREFDRRQSEYYKTAERLHFPEIISKPRRFFTDIASHIITCYEDLSWQLHISSSNDSTIINCRYNLADIGCMALSEKAESTNEAYRILRVECGRMIGTLPEVNSIQEVIQLKEKRHDDLRNLRQELSHLEFELKNGNSKSAIEKAAKDVAKASESFSKGNKICAVNKWMSTFAIGMEAAALYTQNPFFEIGAFLLTTGVGAGIAYGEKVKAQGNWFEMML